VPCKHQRPSCFKSLTAASPRRSGEQPRAKPTFKPLSEAEYEYAARAGTATAYPWGDEIGKGKTNCDGCGSKWDAKQAAPVGSFAPNPFGLYDMVGNVWELVEDCWHNNYNGAPTDGSARIEGKDCKSHVVRGGSWQSMPPSVRTASRNSVSTIGRNNNLGFRVGRMLLP
jgi:formylglycine-generating enzyme required for sulfatase activity